MSDGTWYLVKAGDDIISIAASFGHSDWNTIWWDADNVQAREQQPDYPWDPFVLEPGMQLWIPALTDKAEDSQTEELHEFVVPTQGRVLRLRLMDGDQPMADAPYRLTVGSETFDGRTNADGFLEHPIADNAENGHLNFGLVSVDLLIGHLDPISTGTGLQARLNNMGFECGPVDGIIGPATRGAVRSFQRAHRTTLAVDGIAGPKTRTRLADLHGR